MENWQWLFSFWHVLFTIKTMFWSMHHFLLTKSREILIVFWARNNSRVEATVTNIPLTFTAQIYILYSNMAATNAMIFSLGCILYSKLSRSLYTPLFHTYTGWTVAWHGERVRHVLAEATHWESEQKKKHDRLRLLETSKNGNDSLVFGMYYLLSKQCFDLCIIYMLTKKAEILIV